MRDRLHSIRGAAVGFLRRRILPRPVRIALLGPEGSGKTTLLRAIDDPRYGYPLDDEAANRMDVDVPDQDTIAVPYRVFGSHGFRDFTVKDYRGTHFGSGQFHNRVVEGAEGVVVLLRSPRLANDSDDVRRLKKAYLDVCAKLSGVRAAVLLEVEPEKTPASKRAALDAFRDELQNTIATSGVSENAIKRWGFPTQRKNPSRQQWQEAAKQAAAPFLWLAEQLDQSLWTWMRTRWWTWIVLASVFVSALFAAFVPVRSSGKTHPGGGVESKGTNSILHSDTETNALTETRRPRDGRIGHSTKNGTVMVRDSKDAHLPWFFPFWMHRWTEDSNASPVSPIAKEIRIKQSYLASFEPKSEEWQAWERQRAAITNVLAWNLYDEACRADTSFRAYVDSAIVANDEMAVDLFEKDVNSNLDWLEMFGRTQDMAEFGNRLLTFSSLTNDSGRTEKLFRLQASWTNGWESFEKAVSPLSIVKRTHKILEDGTGRISEKQKAEARNERRIVLDSTITNVLANFMAEAKEPSVGTNGLPKDAEEYSQFMFPDEIKKWAAEIEDRQSELVKQWIDSRGNEKNARTLLRDYAVFARNHKDNPSLQNATSFVGSIVDNWLIRLSTKFEDGHDLASSYEELKNLCNALLNPMVSKTSFGTRWETEFAKWYLDESSKTNSFTTRMSVKSEEPEPFDKYCIAVAIKSKNRTQWIVLPPDFNSLSPRDELNMSNTGLLLGNSMYDVFPDSEICLFVWEKGTRVKSVKKKIEDWEKDDSSKIGSLVSNTPFRRYLCWPQDRPKVQCWVSGIQLSSSALANPLQKLRDLRPKDDNPETK